MEPSSLKLTPLKKKLIKIIAIGHKVYYVPTKKYLKANYYLKKKPN
jgi:hypothetical protein